MKRILLSIFAFAVMGIAAKVQAQCELSNVSANLNSATPNVGSPCTVNLDIAFDMVKNGGSKYVWINLWRSTDYNFVTPNPYAAPSDGKGPTMDMLNGADNTHPPAAVFGFRNDVDPPQVLTTYSSDPSNITPLTGYTITRTDLGTHFHYVITGLQFVVPGACSGLVLQGDVWGSQANSGRPQIHCYSQGISFFGDPTIAGVLTCTTPRQVVVVLNSVSIAPLTVNYSVHRDEGPAGYDAADPIVIPQTADFVLSNGSPYNSGPMNYAGNNVPATANKNLVVKLNVVSPFTKTVSGVIANGCIGLPVEFASFTAKRTSSNVNLVWQTTLEMNNQGFYVERNISGNWEQVGFVPSQASNGTSSEKLTYSFVDFNNVKGISQYRLRQQDFDGKVKLSEIRSVRGQDQPVKLTVYPNPTADGKVNIVFDDAIAVRNVTVSDMSGRVVKQMNGITNNNITIENLQPGMYTVRVVVPETGAQGVEKIVVNKR